MEQLFCITKEEKQEEEKILSLSLLPLVSHLLTTSS